jgi:hypothetical protein
MMVTRRQRLQKARSLGCRNTIEKNRKIRGIRV